MNSTPNFESTSDEVVPVSILKRGWLNLFFNPEGNCRRLCSVNTLWVAPFSLIIDGTMLIDIENGRNQHERVQKDRLTDAIIREALSEWSNGPVPFAYPSRDKDLDEWLNSVDSRLPSAGISIKENRRNHFSLRAGETIYGTGLRYHKLLEKPIDVRSDLGMDVRGIRIWALEILVSPNFNFEKASSDRWTRSVEVVCHLEAIASTPYSRAGASAALYDQLLQALNVLARRPGTTASHTAEIDPSSGEVTGVQETDSKLEDSTASPSAMKKGRMFFHNCLAREINRNCLGESVTLFLDAFESADKVPNSSDGTIQDSVSLERRSFSIIPFVFWEGAVGNSALLETLSPHEKEQVREGLMLNALVGGSRGINSGRIARVQHEVVSISANIRYLVLRDGIAYSFSDVADTYNAAAIAYTFGIRLDQFLLGRATSRVLEQLGVAITDVARNAEGHLEYSDPDERSASLKSLRRNLTLFDEDLVKAKGVYWHTASSGSARSNALLEAYRREHRDVAVLELLTVKRAELTDLVTSSMQYMDEIAAESTSKIFKRLSVLAGSAIVSTQVMDHPSMQELSFWSYLGIWIAITVMLGIIAWVVIDRIQSNALLSSFKTTEQQK